MTNVINVNCYF